MVGTRCTVAVCNNSLVKTEKDPATKHIKYHSFPKDKFIRSQWVQLCKRGGKWNPNSCHVCSIHFLQDDYERDLQAELLNLPPKRILKKKAVPSLHLGNLTISNIAISTLPEILCLKQYYPSATGYKVWSLQDIPVGVRFGPYQETCVAINKDNMKLEQVERIDKEISTLDGRGESGHNWLLLVNCAHHEEEANLITFHTKSEMYYITCRSIPANTELLLYDRDYDIEDTRGYKKKDARNCENMQSSECNSWEKKFVCRNSLILHKIIHSDEKPFKCSACGKKFKYKNKLNQHERIHSGEKPFKCNACGKNFNQRSNFIVHQKIHTSEKPFECNACQRKFSRKNYLTIHERTHCVFMEHYKRSREDKEILQIKRSLFANKEKQNITSNHEATTYTVNNRHSLHVHVTVHTDEKPFECNTCGKRFCRKNDLKMHERVHTGEQPFECNTCAKTFIRENDLNIHETVHYWRKAFPM